MWRKKALEQYRQEEVEYLRKQNTELIQIVAKATSVNTIFEQGKYPTYEEAKKRHQKKTEWAKQPESIEVKKEELLKTVVVPELGGVISKQQQEQYRKEPQQPEEQYQKPQNVPDVIKSIDEFELRQKRAYHRKKQQVRGKRIHDSTADRITKTMNTPIVQHRYDTIIEYLRGGQKKIPEIVETTNISTNSVKAHLRYGVETGTITFAKKRGKLRVYWLTAKPSITEVTGKFDNSGYLKIPKKEGL